MRNIAHNLISILLVPSVAVGIAGCGSEDAKKPKPALKSPRRSIRAKFRFISSTTC